MPNKKKKIPIQTAIQRIGNATTRPDPRSDSDPGHTQPWSGSESVTAATGIKKTTIRIRYQRYGIRILTNGTGPVPRYGSVDKIFTFNPKLVQIPTV